MRAIDKAGSAFLRAILRRMKDFLPTLTPQAELAMETVELVRSEMAMTRDSLMRFRQMRGRR